jgi:PAS domain S-box-containing protein
MVDGIADFEVIRLDQSGLVRSWNPGAVRLTGYVADEVVGKHVSMFYTEADTTAGLAEREMASAVRDGSLETEGWRIRKDGTRFWADIVVTARRDPSGTLRGFSKLTRDITARKALEAEHERALDAIEHGDAFFLLDSELRFQLVNQAHERLTRTRRADTLGKRFWDVFPAAADPEGKFWQEYHRVLRDRVSVQFEAYYAPLNLWTDVSAYPSQDGGIAVFFRDITARRRVEAIRSFFLEAGTLLSESLDVATPLRHLARLVVRYLADYCIVDLTDDDGRLRRVEAVARDDAKQELVRRTLPYSPRQGSRSPVQQAFERGELTVTPLIDAAWLDALAHDEAHRAVLEALEPRSSILVPLEARGRKLGIINIVWAQPGRALPEDVEVARAVAERASVAIDNVRLYQHAQEAIRARDQLWGVASHELRTPLSSLGLQLQLAERLAQQPPGGADAITRVLPKIQAARRQVGRLSNLISELLDTTRAQAGRLELKCEEVDLPALVREQAERHRQEAAHAGSTLHVSAPARLVGHWDHSRLEQVVVNLLTNAIKYGEGKPIHVSVKQLDTAAACLEVRDEGMGIEPESLERIFQPFERTREARKRGGLGLGLFIVRQLVEAHGGTIQVDSRPGRGSTFTVELPLAPETC